MTSSPALKVVICDDEQQVSKHWAEDLKAVAGDGLMAFTAMSPADVSAAALCLENRQIAARGEPDGEPDRNLRADACSFDDADILIVDYDLLELPGESSKLSIVGETGERLAYLARCFSDCGYIIALNQFDKYPVFDLTLSGHLGSYADLNLCSEDISNPWLWHDQPPADAADSTGLDYRPWYWPLVSQAARTLASTVQWLLEEPSRLDQPLLSLLGLDAEPRLRTHWMSGQLEYLGSRGGKGCARTPFEVTARDFVHASGNGVKGKDCAPDDHAVARIFAYRIHKWLERHVLPAQEIAVDAPHLATRLPSIISDDQSWSSLCSRGEGVERHLRADVAERRILEKWTTRPVWDWRRLRSDSHFPEVSDPWGAKLSPYVFLEDTSSFTYRSQAKPFEASVFGPVVQRFTSDPGLTGIAYEPAVRYLYGDE